MERETKMDEGTMKDYIEDLLRERGEMYEDMNIMRQRITHLAAEVKRLENELARHA